MSNELENLLEDVTSTSGDTAEQASTVISVDNLFASPEEKLNWTHNFIQAVLAAWSNNDRVIQVFVKSGYAALLKEFVASEEVASIAGQLSQIYQKLVEGIEFTDEGESTEIKMRTLKQHLSVEEIIAVQTWANNPRIKLHETLAQARLIIQPTTEELRLLALLDTLLDIREKNQSNLVVPGRLPTGIR